MLSEDTCCLYYQENPRESNTNAIHVNPYVYLKVHADVKLQRLVVQVLDPGGHAAHGDAELVADEGGGGAVSVGGLHQAQLEISLEPCLEQIRLDCAQHCQEAPPRSAAA